MEGRTVSVTRQKYSFQEAEIEYHSQCGESFKLSENSGLVDGIGGIIWDGALVLSNVLENIITNGPVKQDCHVMELGCGTGLCGIAAAKLNCRVTLTDREIDLAAVNTAKAFPGSTLHSTDITSLNLSWECSTLSEGAKWTEEQEFSTTTMDLLKLRGKPDIIVGAEITVLKENQPILVNTITDLCEANPYAVVLLSFDEVPPTLSSATEKREGYEIEMIERMTDRGFRHLVVGVADCNWKCTVHSKPNPDEKDCLVHSHITSEAILRDRTSEFCDVECSLLRPFRGIQSKTKVSLDNTCDVKQVSTLPMPPAYSQSKESGVRTPARTTVTNVRFESTTHHITAFFRPSAVGVCSRCQKEYFLLPSLLSDSACEHHASMYVCRYHPAEVRCSIDGLGDGLGYYGNGEEGYDAKFWDCCGAVDENAIGCCRTTHQSY